MVMSYVCLHMLPGLPQGAEARKNAGLSTDPEAALDLRRLFAVCFAGKEQTAPMSCVVVAELNNLLS